MFRPPRSAWTEQLAAAGLAFGLLTLLKNGLTPERHLLRSLAQDDWVLAGFDLTALLLGAPCLASASLAAKH